MNNKLEIPQETNLDKIHALIKGAIGSVPFIGSGLASEIFSLIFSQPIIKRRDAWMQEIVQYLIELEKKQGNIVNDLLANEEFVSLLLIASNNAVKTHLDEKRTYLRNAISNSHDDSIGFDVMEAYMQFINDLSLMQIHLLKSISVIPDEQLYQLSTYVKMYDKLVSDKDAIDLIAFRFLIKNLEAKGLIFLSRYVYEISNEVFGDMILVPENNKSAQLPFIKITDFGTQFLDYISTDT